MELFVKDKNNKELEEKYYKISIKEEKGKKYIEFIDVQTNKNVEAIYINDRLNEYYGHLSWIDVEDLNYLLNQFYEYLYN
ncbi:MAG: hypothetical protein LBS50_08235 [Prevotellaceae bacterium]|jgi:hypothetical protein|nr:hypothetical protein [Prevotellaceae bacterium]